MGKQSKAKRDRRADQRRTGDLLHRLRTRPIPDQSEAYEQPGMVNGYRCPLGHTVYTINRDAGVTSAFMACLHVEARGFPVVQVECGLRAASLWYRVVDPIGVPVTYEWHRPDAAERRQLDLFGAEHVASGGLLLRKLAEPVFVEAVARG